MERLKQEIITKSEEQKNLKKERKTGTIPELPRNEWGISWGKVPENVTQKLEASWKAASQIQLNKIRITAALNLYHELRGSDYRHNVSDNIRWYYDNIYEELRKSVESGVLRTPRTG